MAYTRETAEGQDIELLKTHYYKTNYEDMRNATIEFLEKNHFEYMPFNDDYGETMCQKGKFTITIKIIQQNLRETSIDFFMQYEGFFGRKRKMINFLTNIYNHLNKKFEFKGLGLHQ